jgi:hypothetical protein
VLSQLTNMGIQASSLRPNTGGNTAERNNQLRAFLRDGKRLGNNRKRKDRESGVA